MTHVQLPIFYESTPFHKVICLSKGLLIGKFFFLYGNTLHFYLQENDPTC